MSTKSYRKKKRLRKKADKLWYEVNLMKEPNCVVCGKPANQVHHFYGKGAYGHLRYDLDNGISICQGCHFKHHTRADAGIHLAIIEKKGQEWVERLKKKAKNRPESSYKTIGYYENQIDKLKKIKEDLKTNF